MAVSRNRGGRKAHRLRSKNRNERIANATNRYRKVVARIREAHMQALQQAELEQVAEIDAAVPVLELEVTEKKVQAKVSAKTSTKAAGAQKVRAPRKTS